MVSKWRKAKLALGCIQLPRTQGDNNSNNILSSSSAADVVANNNNNNVGIGIGEGPRRFSDAEVSPAAADCRPPSLLTPTPSSSGLRFSRNSSKSSKKNCAICLTTMIPGQGHAIFTAECSHSFHFHCITSNVKHGNHICPVCRAKWKEIPFQDQTPEVLRRKLRSNSVNWNRDNPLVAALHQLPLPQPDANQNIFPTYRVAEPAVTFDDDDPIEEQHTFREQSAHNTSDSSIRRVEIRACPEVSAIAKSASYDNFTVLIHLKAPVARVSNYNPSSPSGSQHSRAPVDLVTVLDVSGSMAGTKLALLKRAMGFVIQHLGPRDRLSVIVFSSSARRLFPLRRMTDTGRRQALQAVNSLSSNGGTNIAEGLKKGAKVMLERKYKNPVSSIILLSDGQDTYTVVGLPGVQSRNDYKSLLPNSIQQISGTSCQIPVHTFGFGADHDSVSMHSISEGSGGTFSFIEAEGVIQDAFAQCIGGLLSVVVQELKLELECVYPSLQLGSIKAGSYNAQLMPDARTGHINVGDLYAEEERDFLVTMNIPHTSLSEMPLLKVRCKYNDPITNDMGILSEVEEVIINRPETTGHVEVSREVDKQRNRLKAADAMSEARSAAEHGDLAGAVSILETCRQTLSESASAEDPPCVALINELKEMQDRMSSRQVYEASGRAYVLSGLSSHSWQRATARGDTTSSTSLSQSYQTSFMADMITRSQTMVLGSLPASPPVRPPRSLSGRPSPR
ncbi:E3 ubiquitin-protein ligase WAV3 isoform X1 [Beta vulgaris subsp. vulgaris]|uniref:E3 ubiquitin-protein ligase WAV3 isoform X1 n=1 Tax=Beta vulgaris subsp. vulgaris TaxID=3555 RepID=UPI002037553B|nr:E3 ubiquitin-protein ligase WAV3 isoform X1 [Beta vulgaris subsp. vulgaris]